MASRMNSGLDKLANLKLNEDVNVREYTDMLFDMVEDGIVDAKEILQSLMYWCSEDDVKKFMQVNDLLWEPEEEEDEDYFEESMKSSTKR